MSSKKRLARDQLRLLEASFNANQRLTAELKIELAGKLGLSPRQVAIWYQNRRARQKADSMEHDYKKIQLDLCNVLAGNSRLEKEVKMLRHELTKSQQLLLLASTSHPDTLPAVAALCHDHPNSSSPGNISYNMEMPVCFI